MFTLNHKKSIVVYSTPFGAPLVALHCFWFGLIQLLVHNHNSIIHVVHLFWLQDISAPNPYLSLSLSIPIWEIGRYLLPISHPSSVSPPTTTTHRQKLLSTFPWSERLLRNMHLHTLVHPCGALYLLHYMNLNPHRNSQELHIIILTHSHDQYLYFWFFKNFLAKYWIFSCFCMYLFSLIFVLSFCCTVLFQSA